MVSLCVFSQTGCYYDNILAIGGIDREVSFSADVIPVFNASCNLSGCHSGGINPDLRPANAYNPLINGNYVDIANPTESTLYKHLIGTLSLMPPEGKLPNDQISLILGWMEQGAINN